MMITRIQESHVLFASISVSLAPCPSFLLPSLMPTELSPIKSKRMEEKASLQQLNSRLEMYVLGVNELEGAKHAAERELETLKQRMQQDLESVRTRLTKELEDTRK
ncbi:hypothetical protein PsorP6_010350 [Peronosclerospora sorghi]|uniref:Uncharacterized protein n=1 Tax=Peronosclerospora sorghi TaxID=230839 RepID=A0ACC0VW42_9STRA|nr:hypothetical protein PsorP6_010350 [Peronosclerospora sorghi]